MKEKILFFVIRKTLKPSATLSVAFIAENESAGLPQTLINSGLWGDKLIISQPPLTIS